MSDVGIVIILQGAEGIVLCSLIIWADSLREQRDKEILEQLNRIEKVQETIRMDISKLSTAFSTFAADFGTFKADLATFLGTLTPQDPAQQTAIDDFTAKLGQMDTDVQGMDASLKPPTP